MNSGLFDTARLRRLRAHCRRNGMPRRRWRWTESGPPDGRILRLGLIGLFAVCGALVAQAPLATQLLAVGGICAMQARIRQLRHALYDDDRLMVFASLPLSPGRVAWHQTRPVWRAAGWAAADAAAFWCCAWSVLHAPGWCWWWLPVVAAAHATITLALTWLLLPRWPSLGPLPGMVLAVLFVLLAQSSKHPDLAACVDPVLVGLSWLTPWGALHDLCARLPEQGAIIGVIIAASGGIALVIARTAARRQLAAWTAPEFWRDQIGRPQGPEHQELASTGTAARIAADEPPPDPDMPVDEPGLRRALAAARERIGHGRALDALGWAGRTALRHFTPTQRVLADALLPVVPDAEMRRTALLLVALPAVVVLLHAPLWLVPSLLAVALLVRRQWSSALLTTAACGCAWLLPSLRPIFCLALPHLIALLMIVPFLGGRWGALPSAWWPLGTLPRTWADQLRVMVRVQRLRLLALLPLLTLIAAAWSGWDDLGRALAGTAVGWLGWIIVTPPLCGHLLVQRGRPGVIHLEIGRWWLSLPHLLLATLMLLCLGFAVCAAGLGFGDALGDALLAGGFLLAMAAAAAFDALVLRHAYRRHCDQITPRAL